MMLLAALAFVLQTSGTIVARAAAESGFMPQAAEVVSGAVHFHGPISHTIPHGSGAPGHVHHPAGSEDPDFDHDSPVWTLGCAHAVVPLAEYDGPSTALGILLDPPVDVILTGVRPEALTRPPSTPGIA
jgi:hypothetical protein